MDRFQSDESQCEIENSEFVLTLGHPKTRLGHPFGFQSDESQYEKKNSEFVLTFRAPQDLFRALQDPFRAPLWPVGPHKGRRVHG